MTENDFLMGYTIYAIELGKCGEKEGVRGALDIHATFGEEEGETTVPVSMLVFTETTDTVKIIPRL